MTATAQSSKTVEEVAQKLIKRATIYHWQLSTNKREAKEVRREAQEIKIGDIDQASKLLALLAFDSEE